MSFLSRLFARDTKAEHTLEPVSLDANEELSELFTPRERTVENSEAPLAADVTALAIVAAILLQHRPECDAVETADKLLRLARTYLGHKGAVEFRTAHSVDHLRAVFAEKGRTGSRYDREAKD